ncbi:DUF4865 family protein [Streptomyces narbonensis]|uniref:DUF4865 family protein n=1 Tax=Streptomyces narbonensis TaxID=67333 RepID=UPI00167C4244|nr:DUF4865 family protein [Streptomyces narbonensis]GGW03487.1 DUF4865 domain-containing protein [Streptomyces narbonensis]
MHAMQYEITLPADYDMGIIHERVATRGHLLDAFPGLGLKAYLVREREAGSPVNQYAPFYLWATPEGMNSFLWGPGFQGIVDDFGRPVVQHWTGLSYEEGPASASAPAAATRRRTTLGEGVPPGEAVAEAVDRHAREARREGVVASALAVDPRHWELLAFTLWADAEAPADEGERFRVLHLSAPGRGALGVGGRRW